MSSKVAQLDQTIEGVAAHSWRISKRLLLSIYLIIPAVWLVVAIDVGYLHGYLRKALPASPEDFYWFTAFFVIPHVLASQFTFYDREYLNAYRKQLQIGLPLVLAGAVILYRFDHGSHGVIFIAVTMWHLIAQQVGIARSLVGETSRAFTVWRWLTIAVFTAGITGILGPWLIWVGTPLLLTTTLLTFHVSRLTAQKVARHYLWANQGMALSAAFLSVGGYWFFSVLIPRVIHDGTAWVFYLTHDHNRNLEGLHNRLYRAFAFAHLPLVVLVPGLAFGLNAALNQDIGVFYHAVAIPISLFHYYSESFMWRRHSMHRQYIKFSP